MVDDYGYVEQANETPLVFDPAEASLPVFPDAGSDTQTVAVVDGVASVRATAYSNPITNTAENQPLNAVDGNPQTSWKEGAFSPATDESIQVNLVHPVTADHITLLQAQNGAKNRTVTNVTLSFDHGPPVTAALGRASHAPPGQVVKFPSRTFGWVTVTIKATSAGVRKDYRSQSAVGFSEIGIPGVAPAKEVLRLPTDLLAATGARSLDHPLDILLNRIRAQVTRPGPIPRPPWPASSPCPRRAPFDRRHGPDLDDHPRPRRWTGWGAAPAAPGDRARPPWCRPTRRAACPATSARRPVRRWTSSPATSWEPGLGHQPGNWVDYQLSRPVTFDHLDLQVVADGRHSIPIASPSPRPRGPGR